MNQFDRLFDLSGLSLDRLRTFLMVEEAGNLSKAANGDATKQSQYSRQIKELESFFGAAFTRRVGRRIEITNEGHLLAAVIRRHFRELDEFREAMAGREVCVRFGSQGSVIDWLLVPRLAAVRVALGNAMIEMEQMRSLDTVRAVADGRLDFGIVREDALPPETKRWRLGGVGYALFGANAHWRGCNSSQEVISKAPVADLKVGGQFVTRWHEWLSSQKIRAKVTSRVSSFAALSRVVQAGDAVAALPEMAAVDFDPKRFKSDKIEALKPRMLVLIANERSLDRSGIAQRAATNLAEALKLK